MRNQYTDAGQKYRKINAQGITAIIINHKKVLLLKRRNFPFMLNPGVWFFVSGSRKSSEKYLGTAYREILEETGIRKDALTPLKKIKSLIILDPKNAKMWKNKLFIFRSKESTVKLNIEHNAYKWASLAELRGEGTLTLFPEQKAILGTIRQHLK